MSETVTLAEQWRAEFDRLEANCPWAGPRPLSAQRDADAPYRFVAREGETAHFLNLVSDNSLVVYHGESGAGKTSLLGLGLVDGLEDKGFAPLLWRSWGVLGDQDPEVYLQEQLRGSGQLHDAVLAELDQGRSLIEVLDQFYRDRAVLILDQFEHLIRGRSRGFANMVSWLLRVNSSHQTRIVISLRSEYTYRLATLMKSARPFTTAYLELKAMDSPEQIQAVVRAPRDSGITSISEEAEQLLLRLWRQSAGLSTDSGSGFETLHTARQTALRAPKLLAVQACLYALNLAAQKRTGLPSAEVSEVDLVDLAEKAAAERATDGHRDQDIFNYCFTLAIAGRLEHCMQAAQALPLEVDGRRDGIPSALTALARGCVVDVVDHLSSGGYKIERSVGDLFLRSKDREVRVARWPAESGRAAESVIKARGSLDYLRADRLEIAQFLNTSSAEPFSRVRPSHHSGSRVLQGDDLASLGVYPGAPWDDDPEDMSAGAMLGLRPEEVLIEQLRAFAFALEWLETASLVDLDSGDDRIVVSLIHDGFGGALETWAARTGTEPQIAASALVAYEGRRFDWAESGANFFTNCPDEPLYLANIRWRYCRIVGASLKSVVFLNCDFRGAVFADCTFEGVTFVNCLLDGAAFEECTIVGPAELGAKFESSWAAAASDKVETSMATYVSHEAEPTTVGEMKSDLPGFIASGSDVAALRRELAWYRDGVPGDTIYSPTSGVAAVPWAAEPAALDWHVQKGGLVMYGGRLSSLMVRDCDFGANGGLALCHMAGSSLDFVEQNGGNITLFSTTVRGVAVTAELPSRTVRPSNMLTFKAYDCVLADLFFGVRVEGQATILESTVFGASSASEQLDVHIDKSAVASVSNVRLGAGATMLRGFGTGTSSGRARGLLAERTERMAYRSRPAARELLNRLTNKQSASESE